MPAAKEKVNAQQAGSGGVEDVRSPDAQQLLGAGSQHRGPHSTYQGSWALSTMATIRPVSRALLGNSHAPRFVRTQATSVSVAASTASTRSGKAAPAPLFAAASAASTVGGQEVALWRAEEASQPPEVEREPGLSGLDGRRGNGPRQAAVAAGGSSRRHGTRATASRPRLFIPHRRPPAGLQAPEQRCSPGQAPGSQRHETPSSFLSHR